jgi:hypothetical protein
MHKRYRPEDFAAISVDLDDPADKETASKVRSFLESQGADFSNLVLDEKQEFWQEKLRFDGPPCVYVFDRQGGIARQFKDEFTYDDVEKLVKELIAKKGP